MIISGAESSGVSRASKSLADSLLARLDQHYPAFQGYWCIAVNEIGGTIEVSNTLLSGKMGFLMHIAKIDPEGKKVVRAGGELLERYRVSRARGLTLRSFMDQSAGKRMVADV